MRSFGRKVKLWKRSTIEASFGDRTLGRAARRRRWCSGRGRGVSRCLKVGGVGVVEFLLHMPRGHYDARVESSEVAREPFQVTLALRMACGNKHGLYSTRVKFAIHHLVAGKERRSREALLTLASVLGVEQLEDSEQLRGRPFRMTVWNERNMRVSFRPAP